MAPASCGTVAQPLSFMQMNIADECPSVEARKQNRMVWDADIA